MQIKFQKYTQAATDDYTTLEPSTELELANAIINILMNRKKGFPREIRHAPTESEPWIVIDTNITQEKPREKKKRVVDPTLE